MRELEQCRKEIDDIDRKMVKLFCQRMELAREIALIKKSQGVPIFDSAREATILADCLSLLPDERFSESLVKFLQYVMDLSKQEQRKLLNKK
jgi:chorismate mutase/prephenate dehydratase